MGCSQNYGRLEVIDYITAPTIYVYPNGTLILGTPRMESLLYRGEEALFLE